jgi:NAD-dependent dihydropyrimidine dehydrogenase PreA subunit
MVETLAPIINTEKCTGCGLCVGVCTCGRLTIVGGVAVFSAQERCGACHRWCCQCEIVCPEGAITCPFDVTVEGK